MAVSSAPPARRRWGLWLLAAAAVLVIAALSVLLALALARPAPTAAAATPAAPVTPLPTPSESPAAGDAAAAIDQQHQEYRAYVAIVLQGTVAVASSLTGLEQCRDNRSACAASLQDASDQVAKLQTNLAGTTAPACLSSADAKLDDALSFQKKGLDAAKAGVESQNRVLLVQGVLLVAAGTWRAGQAVVDARQSNC